MLCWDGESGRNFRTGGITVKDLDRRFQMEDEGYMDYGKFNWTDLKEVQMNINQFL